jgi:hypothetical protein
MKGDVFWLAGGSRTCSRGYCWSKMRIAQHAELETNA